MGSKNSTLCLGIINFLRGPDGEYFPLKSVAVTVFCGSWMRSAAMKIGDRTREDRAIVIRRTTRRAHRWEAILQPTAGTTDIYECLTLKTSPRGQYVWFYLEAEPRQFDNFRQLESVKSEKERRGGNKNSINFLL